MTHFKVDTAKGICSIDILDSLRVRDLVSKAAGVKGIERGAALDLIYNRNTLATNLRLSHIPSGSVLELVPAGSRKPEALRLIPGCKGEIYCCVVENEPCQRDHAFVTSGGLRLRYCGRKIPSGALNCRQHPEG